jgi:hypothetical protein
MHAERDLIIDIVATRNGQREMVENPLAKIVPEGETVRGRKINARLPFLGATVQRVWRYSDLH